MGLHRKPFSVKREPHPSRLPRPQPRNTAVLSSAVNQDRGVHHPTTARSDTVLFLRQGTAYTEFPYNSSVFSSSLDVCPYLRHVSCRTVKLQLILFTDNVLPPYMSHTQPPRNWFTVLSKFKSESPVSC